MIKVRDDRGRELLFTRAPRRIVSLVPSDSYTVTKLVGLDALVGRTDYCDEPRGAIERVPSVGGTKDAKVDAILDLRPDLVIANQEENTRSDLEKLGIRGIRVYVAFPKRAADGLAHLARLARIFRVDADPKVRQLLKDGYEAIREAEDARKNRAPLRAFCPIWMKPLMTINGETFISDVLDLAGAANVFADRERRYPLAADLGSGKPMPADGRDTRYPRVTLDEVTASAPELVILPDEPHPFTEEDADVFRALALPAAARGAVVRTSGKDLCWYGARTVEGLPRVRELVDRFR